MVGTTIRVGPVAVVIGFAWMPALREAAEAVKEKPPARQKAEIKTYNTKKRRAA